MSFSPGYPMASMLLVDSTPIVPWKSCSGYLLSPISNGSVKFFVCYSPISAWSRTSFSEVRLSTIGPTLVWFHVFCCSTRHKHQFSVHLYKTATPYIQLQLLQGSQASCSVQKIQRAFITWEGKDKMVFYCTSII